MNVIFLDVDGVLTYSDYDNEETADIDIEKVKLLKEICDETNAKIVISSSWRGSGTHTPQIYYTLLNILASNGIDVLGNTSHIKSEFEEDPPDLISLTALQDPSYLKIKYGTGRAAEIRQWLNEHEVDNFVILDDGNYNWAAYDYATHWVQPTWFGNGGLKREHVDRAIKILEGDLNESN